MLLRIKIILTSLTISDLVLGSALKIVKIEAKTWGASVGSFSSFSLESDSGRRVRGGSMTISTKGSERGESSTTIRNLQSGSYYYIRAISGINWEVKVYEYR